MSYHVLRYIVLLFHSIYVSGAAQTMEGRVKALRRVRIFNMPLGVGSMLEGFKANDVKYESTQKHFWNWECSSPDWKVNLIQSRPMSLMFPDVPAFSSSFERFKIQGWWWWFGPSINVHRSLALFFWTWLIQVPGAAGCRRVPPGVAPSFAFAPGASGFLSPAQCAWLESNPAPENPVGGCCGFVICFVDTWRIILL